ncbi:MAG: helix-turn-helix domain-containing protein [Desulfobacterales bacterium]|jgi:formate hydrogenlyase transcriptional activator
MDTLDNPQKHLTTTSKTLETVERDHIVRVLEKTQWKVSEKNGASEILGLNLSTLRAHMRNLTSENHKFSSQFQFTLIICHP